MTLVIPIETNVVLHEDSSSLSMSLVRQKYSVTTPRLGGKRTRQPHPYHHFGWITVWARRRRLENALDRWDGRVNRRVLTIDGKEVEVAVHEGGRSKAPQLEVDLPGSHLTVPLRKGVENKPIVAE